MFGSQVYAENQFPPEQVGNRWHVWCMSGALKVVNQLRQQLEVHTEIEIFFANGSCASIAPGSELWKKLAEFTATCRIFVFPLTWSGKWIEWNSEETNRYSFDAIRIIRS